MKENLLLLKYLLEPYRTKLNKLQKYMTPESKSVYTDKITGIAKKYSNTCRNTSKMQPGDEKSITY